MSPVGSEIPKFAFATSGKSPTYMSETNENVNIVMKMRRRRRSCHAIRAPDSTFSSGLPCTGLGLRAS